MKDRPKSIRAVFLLTCLKILIAWTFFAVAASGVVLPVDATKIAYTASAYVAIAIPTFVFIHRRSAIAVRVCIALAIAVSLPTGAVIAILLDLIALGLTFRPPARRFFAVSA